MRTLNLEHRLRAFVLGLAVLGPLLCLVAHSAEGDASAEEAKDAKKKPLRDPNNVTGLSEAMENMVQGNAKFMQKDYPGAIELYQKALKLQPKHPLAHYLVGETHLAAGRPAEAETSFKAADEAAGSNSPHKARVLFALADVLERQKKLDDAKAVWTRYLEQAAKTDGGAFPESGKARVAAVDEVIKQDKAYEVVRQRIAAEKDGGAATPSTGADAGKSGSKK
jgi:tetratricopeptide (TPR) repeat protein